MVIVACKCLNITTTIADNEIDLTTRKSFSPNGTVSPSTAAAPHTVEFLKEAVGPFTNPTNLRIETKHDELTGARRLQITTNGTTSATGAAAAPQCWVLVNCLNCDQAVYATRATPVGATRKSVSSIEDPSAPRTDDFAVVFNGKLLTTLEAINTLKADESYSKIYKVIIRQRSSTILSMLSSSSSPPKVAATVSAQTAAVDSADLINSTDPRLKNLTSLLNERLRKEIESTEERIRQYTTDQFVALKVFRQAAEAEFVHLAQKLLAEPSQQPPNELLLPDAGNKKLISISVVGGMLLETPPLTPDSGTMTMGNSPPRLLNSSSARSLGPIMNSSSAGGGVGGLKMPGRYNVLRKRNSDAGPTTTTGGFDDDDDFFGMDGYFPGNNHGDGGGGLGQPMSDFDEDFDEEDELEVTKESGDTGRHIPTRSDYLGQSANAMMMAKSLPMATPALPSRAHPDDSDEGLDDNVDIAASIKALAKSVHRSDDIFGDLPRTRVRTKI